MIILTNLNQPKAIPAFFDTKEDFIEYTIEEATWTSLPTGEVPTKQKWGFTKVVDDVTTNECGKAAKTMNSFIGKLIWMPIKVLERCRRRLKN